MTDRYVNQIILTALVGSEQASRENVTNELLREKDPVGAARMIYGNQEKIVPDYLSEQEIARLKKAASGAETIEELARNYRRLVNEEVDSFNDDRDRPATSNFFEP